MKRSLVLLSLVLGSFTVFSAQKKIIFVAGKASHGGGQHEHRAGCLLLKKALDQGGLVTSEVHSNGWPTDEKVFDGASAVVFYADGGAGHPAIKPERLQVLGNLVSKG